MKAKKIRIPKELMKEWGALRSTSDVGQIADLCDVFPQQIYRVFDSLEATVKVFEVMADFYQGKKELLEKYISDYND